MQQFVLNVVVFAKYALLGASLGFVVSFIAGVIHSRIDRWRDRRRFDD